MLSASSAPTPAYHMAILANAALKPRPRNRHVFCRVFLLFGELRILLGSLRGSQRVAVPADDVVPRVFLVLVFPVRLSVTDGDLNQFRIDGSSLFFSHSCPEQEVAPTGHGVFQYTMPDAELAPWGSTKNTLPG